MFKKFTRLITALVATSILVLTGCFLIKEGETINWNKVDTVASGIKVLTQTTTYAVCYKNQDLTPIFKAIGEGLIVISGSADASQMSPEQIQKYINESLSKYGTLGSQVNAITVTIISEYNNFWQNNSDVVKDEVKVISKIVKAIGEGFVVGANIVPTTTVAAPNKTPEQDASEAKVSWSKVCLKVSDPIE